MFTIKLIKALKQTSEETYSLTSELHPVQLTYSPPPQPPTYPLLPLWYCHLLAMRTSNTEFYESMVDAMGAAFLGHYFTLQGQFIVRPQHTYRVLASLAKQVQSDQWSIMSGQVSEEERVVCDLIA